MAWQNDKAPGPPVESVMTDRPKRTHIMKRLPLVLMPTVLAVTMAGNVYATVLRSGKFCRHPEVGADS